MTARYSNRSVRLVSVALTIAMLISLAACTAAPTQAPAATTAPAAPAATTAPAATSGPAATTEPAVTAAPTETTAPAATAGGTLTVAVAEAPEAMDPTISLQIFNWTIAFSMFDTLVKVDDEGNISPSLATEWKALTPTSWQLTLRDDVKFHDGKQFTSADVKATLDHIVNPDTKSRQAAIWAAYDRTETPDAQTAIVHTKTPMGTMLTNLSLTLIIQAEPSQPLETNPVGTGPFKFVEWVKDDRVVVEANADYWDGAPVLERIVFRTIPELATRISALERGEVDIVDLIPVEEIPRLEAAGITLIDQPTTYLRFIWLGNQGPLADVRVRKAINLAIDRETLINDLFGGKAYEVRGPVAPNVVGYCEMPPLEYDVEAAKALMEEAGVGPFTLEMKTAEYLAKQKEMAEVIAAMLSEIGITVNVTVQDQALWLQDLMALNWEAEQIGTSTLTGDADYTLRRLYHSASKRIPHTSPEMDELLTAQMGETDEAKRQELFCEIAQKIWDEVPTVFLFGVIQTYGVSTRVENFEPRASQFMFFDEVSVK